MSRIGYKEIKIPDKVNVEFAEKDRLLKVKGPKGELTQKVEYGISFDLEDSKIKVKRESDTKKLKALHGLYRSLLNNMVTGVSEGFTRKLELHGVGYRAQAKGSDGITFQIGYSHPVEFKLPKGITCEIKDNTNVILNGFDKQLLGQTAARIRMIRPPEPYKKKGIRYSGEYIRAKAGKTAK